MLYKVYSNSLLTLTFLLYSGSRLDGSTAIYNLQGQWFSIFLLAICAFGQGIKTMQLRYYLLSGSSPTTIPPRVSIKYVIVSIKHNQTLAEIPVMTL